MKGEPFFKNHIFASFLGLMLGRSSLILQYYPVAEVDFVQNGKDLVPLTFAFTLVSYQLITQF